MTIHESICIACGKKVDTSKKHEVYPDGLVCHRCCKEKEKGGE